MFKRFLANDSGATAVEYALLTSAIFLMIAVGVAAAGKAVGTYWTINMDTIASALAN